MRRHGLHTQHQGIVTKVCQSNARVVCRDAIHRVRKQIQRIKRKNLALILQHRNATRYLIRNTAVIGKVNQIGVYNLAVDAAFVFTIPLEVLVI